MPAIAFAQINFIAYFILFIFIIQFVPALFTIIAGIGSGFGNADLDFVRFFAELFAEHDNPPRNRLDFVAKQPQQ